MAKKRGADFSLDVALRDPGFTPRAGDLEGLLARVARDDDERATASATAVLRVEGPVLSAIVDHLDGGGAAAADAPSERTQEGTARLLELLGRAASRGAEPDDALARAVTTAAAHLADERSAKDAATALAKMLGEPAVHARAAEALGAAVDALAGLVTRAERASAARHGAPCDLDPGLARAVARALGAAGTAAARVALDELGTRHRGDKIISRTRIAAARDEVRPDASALLALDRAAPSPLGAVLACRRGLEEIVREQLSASGRASRVTRPGRVDVELREAPAYLLGAARSALGVGFPLETVGLESTSPDAVGRAVARALTGDAATRVLGVFDRAPFRFRVAFAGGGKHRATAWAIAEAVAAASRGALVNDPRGAPWEVAVALPPPDAARADGFARIELRPRFDDRRFPWRRADVPAASHPTVAAAIATLGGARRGDVVWDPFVGSGGEICERARLGAARRYIGTDVDEGALRSAKLNTDAAKIAAELVLTDARAFDPGEPVDLILSNPPMGRRVLRHRGDVETLLASFLGRAARLLAPDGRLVWVSAHPRATREAAMANHLRLTDAFTIDLGGFDVELQRFER